MLICASSFFLKGLIECFGPIPDNEAISLAGMLAFAQTGWCFNDFFNAHLHLLFLLERIDLKFSGRFTVFNQTL